MDTIEYNGEVYRRAKTKWVDSRNLVVYDGLQNILNQLYLKTLDYCQDVSRASEHCKRHLNGAEPRF